MQNRRNVNIDFIRGLVMCFLPLFHSSGGVIHSIIGLYQMPILMLISGYLSYKDEMEMSIGWLGKRCKRLIFPYIFWNVVYWGARVGTYGMEQWIYNVTAIVYWFLLVLFVFSMLIFFVNKICTVLSGDKFCLLFLAICVDIFLKILSMILDFEFFSLCAWHISFFMGGYLIHRFHTKIKALSRNSNVIICIGLWIGVFIIVLNDFSSRIETGYVGYVLRILYNYGCAVVAMFGVYFLARSLSDKVKKRFEFVSKSSMYIYILHFFFLIDYTGIIYVDVILKSVLGVVIPLIIATIVRKYNWKRVEFLFGE